MVIYSTLVVTMKTISSRQISGETIGMWMLREVLIYTISFQNNFLELTLRSVARLWTRKMTELFLVSVFLLLDTGEDDIKIDLWDSVGTTARRETPSESE